MGKTAGPTGRDILVQDRGDGRLGTAGDESGRLGTAGDGRPLVKTVGDCGGWSGMGEDGGRPHE